MSLENEQQIFNEKKAEFEANNAAQPVGSDHSSRGQPAAGARLGMSPQDVQAWASNATNGASDNKPWESMAPEGARPAGGDRASGVPDEAWARNDDYIDRSATEVADNQHKADPVEYNASRIAGLESSIDDMQDQSDLMADIGDPAAPTAVYGSGLDLSKVALGYVINPNGDDTDEVRVIAGEIDRIEVSQTDLVVTDDEYVYVKRTLSDDDEDDTMLVESDSSVPDDDDTYRYYRLYRFTVADEVATIKNIYRPFDIEGLLPSAGLEDQYLVLNASLVPVWDYMRWR